MVGGGGGGWVGGWGGRGGGGGGGGDIKAQEGARTEAKGENGLRVLNQQNYHVGLCLACAGYFDLCWLLVLFVAF